MKLLPDLVLLPHELPPGSTEPLCAPANARVEIEGQEVLLRVVKVGKWCYVVFLRREGQNFILRSQTVDRFGVMVWKEPTRQSKLERIGHYALRSGWFVP